MDNAHLYAKLRELDYDLRKLEQEVTLAKAATASQAQDIKAWKGYTKRRISEFVVALNENTAEDRVSNMHVRELQGVVKRLDKSEGAIREQETKTRQQRKSNIILFGSLVIVAILVIQGKIASGDIANVLAVVLPGVLGVGVAIRARGE